MGSVSEAPRTQPAHGEFNAPLTRLTVLYKQHGHGVGGWSRAANNPPFGGSIIAALEVSWRLCKWVSRDISGTFILTEER